MANEAVSGVETTPVVEMIGPAGRAIVNKSDQAEWEARGYRLIQEGDGESLQDAPPAPTGDGD